MIKGATTFARAPSRQPFDDHAVGHLDRQNTIQRQSHLLQDLFEALGLRNRPRKTIQNKTLVAIFLL